MFEPAVVSISLVQKISLMAIGIPARGEIFPPAAIFSSTSSAFSNASLAVTVIKALRSSSTSSILFRQERVSSREENFLFLRP